MNWSLFLAAAMSPSTPHHYKLVITYSPGGVTVIDYHSLRECEVAKRELDRDTQRRVEDSQRRTPPGGVTIGTPYHLTGVCIPG